jgi:CRISPR/Cas system-associated endonuclease Cas1
MVRVIELEPAQEAHRCSEIRINKAALDAVERWQIALVVCQYNGKPFPVSLPEESYGYIKALLVQRQAELV